MKKRILVVGSSLMDKGGIVSVMKNIENSCLKESYEFIHIETYITTTTFKKINLFFQAILNFIFKCLKGEGFKVIHIHMSYRGSFYRKAIIILIAHLFNKKIILHIHGSCFKEFYSSLNSLNKNFCKIILNSVDSVIVLSNSWKDYFSLITEDITKIRVIRNCVSLPKYSPSKKMNKEITFLFLGRMQERKGVYNFLKALIEIIDKNKDINIKVHLAGDGEVEVVKKIIVENSLEHIVNVHGWIDGTEKQKLLETSDILILPSYNEGLPVALLEGMSYGIPVISTNVGGIPELIKNQYNGLLIPPGNVQEIKKSIEFYLANPNLISEHGKNARETIMKHYEINREMIKLDKIYKELFRCK